MKLWAIFYWGFVAKGNRWTTTLKVSPFTEIKRRLLPAQWCTGTFKHLKKISVNAFQWLRFEICAFQPWKDFYSNMAQQVQLISKGFCWKQLLASHHYTHYPTKQKLEPSWRAEESQELIPSAIYKSPPDQAKISLQKYSMEWSTKKLNNILLRL